MDKKEQVRNFLIDLKSFISSKAQDIVDMGNPDCDDSCVGMGSFRDECKLEKSLYKLFDIETEDE